MEGKLSKRTRHIFIKGTWLYFLVKVLNVVTLEHISTHNNVADAFTKPLTNKFKFMRGILLGSADLFDWETFQSRNETS